MNKKTLTTSIRQDIVMETKEKNDTKLFFLT